MLIDQTGLVSILTEIANITVNVVFILMMITIAILLFAIMMEIIWKLQEVKPDGGKRSKAEAYRIEDTGRQSGQKAIE